MKILVLGIGNSILRDDGVGPAIVRELEKHFQQSNVVCETTSLAGMPLLDIITGYDSLIVIDAIKSGAKPGEIRWLRTDDFKAPKTECSEHKMGILRVLELGKQLGIDVPQRVHFMAIEANDVTSFIDELTPEVAATIPAAIEQIKQLINQEKADTSLPQARIPVYSSGNSDKTR